MARKTVTVVIKDIKWKFKLLSDKVFDRKHKEGKFRAMTMTGDHCVDFRKSDFTKALIFHELCHAYYTSCLTSDADHNADQVEETLAKILEMHYYEIGTVADQVFNGLKSE